MRNVARWVNYEGEQEAENRQTASLAALAVVLLMAVVCLGLIRVLKNEARVEDCMLAGRLNCTDIVALR